MPNIIQYDATAELTPSDKGIQAAEIAGRRMGQFGQELAADVKGVANAVEQHMGVMETSQLYKTGTELENNATQQLEQASSEAMKNGQYDPNFANHFMANFKPLVDKWASGASTDRGKLLAAEMGARITESVFRRAAAGQTAMDTMQVETNGLQTIHNLSNSLYDDPSYGNYIKVTGTAEQFARESASHIHDVEQQQSTYTSIINRIMPDITIARYKGMEISARRQIGLTDDETGSKALSAYDDAVGKEEGFEHLTAEQKNAVRELREEAVKGGHSDFRIAHEAAKSQMSEEGKAVYAKLHNGIATREQQGLPPTPEQAAAVTEYANKFGGSNPGEAASLDDYITRSADRAQENKVQPYNQQTRDNIQKGISLPKGDPRRVELPMILRNYSAGQITSQDFGMYSGMIEKRDHPESDPTFKAAKENFDKQITLMLRQIGANNPTGIGVAVARSQFLHDATAAFWSQGQSGAGWDKALDNVTNPKNPHSFANVIQFYNEAANKGNSAAQWMQQHDQFNPGPYSAPALGSKSAPIYPTAKTPAPAQPTKIDQKAVDDILMGKH